MKDTAEMILELTAEMAGRIAASRDCTVRHAAREAKEIMADLLGLKSSGFDVMQKTSGDVDGVELTYEI